VSAFIEQARARYGVESICRTLGVSASAYYQRATGERSARSVEDERLLARIREVHEQNFECYGYPRVWHELRRQGEPVGRDHVARLMRCAGIKGAKRRGKRWRTTIADPTAHKRPDLVNRDFSADRPDQLWVGDLTYLRTWEGRMYLAFLIDVFSRVIVGWQLAGHMRSDLVLDALRMALGTRQPGADLALVCHTDQGSQYTAEDYTQLLDDHRVLQSVGTVGDCYDNALSESFVDSYKTELITDRVWKTNAQLELQTVCYVGWFNNHRLHTSIGNRPPVEHEREYWARVALGLEPGPAQAAPTVTDLRDASDRGLSELRI
jgi:transposase InsO family protein